MPDFHSVKKKDLADYPLHIWLNDAEDSKKQQIIAKLPKSTCVPRIGETIAIPVFGETSKMVAIRKVLVSDVIYGLVNEIIHIVCNPLSLERHERSAITVAIPEPLEEFEIGNRLISISKKNADEELE